MGSSSGGGGGGSSRSRSISRTIGNAIGGPVGGAVASGLSSVYNSINSKTPATTQAVGTTPAVGTTSGVYRTSNLGSQQEIDRLTQSYNQKMAAGDVAGANADHLAANAIRNAMGATAGVDYNDVTGAAISGSTQPTQTSNPYDYENMKYKTIDNTALYNQQAAEKAAAIRQSIQRSRTTAEGNISGIESQYGTAIQTAQNQGAQLPAQFTQLNNQASNRGYVNAQRIRTAMAQMGLGQSGESASQQLQQGIDTSNQINTNNQQLQTLTNDINTQVTGLQGERASKVAAIRQAIADAEASGDENAALALSEAQAKIASEASQNAVGQNNWNLDMIDRIKKAQDTASTNAWDRSGFESSIAKEKALQAIRDAKSPLETQLLEAQIANTQRSANAPYSSGGSSGYSATDIKNDNLGGSLAKVKGQVDQAYGNGGWANAVSAIPQIVANIWADADEYRRGGVDPQSLVDYVYQLVGGFKEENGQWVQQ